MVKYCFQQYNYLSCKEETQHFNSEKGTFMYRS